MKSANIALYTVWSGDSLAKDSAKVVGEWLGGRATHFVIKDKIGIQSSNDWRKAIVDLNTMKVLMADPASGKPLDTKDMIKACKKLD